MTLFPFMLSKVVCRFLVVSCHVNLRSQEYAHTFVFVFEQFFKNKSSYKLERIILVNPFPLRMLSGASAEDDFEKIVTKGEIAQNEQFLLLPQYIYIFFFFCRYTLIYRDFLFGCPHVSEVVCCRFV